MNELKQREEAWSRQEATGGEPHRVKGPKGETTACRDGADGTLQITVLSTVSFGSLNSSWRWLGSSSLF